LQFYEHFGSYVREKQIIPEMLLIDTIHWLASDIHPWYL